MENFQLKTLGMILRAIDKPLNESLDAAENEELGEYLEMILTSIKWIAYKEVEAYLIINTCKDYDQFAKLVMRREGKKLKGKEYDRLLGRLRTRAHRGRKKIINKLREIYAE